MTSLSRRWTAVVGRLPKLILSPDSSRRQNFLNLHPTGFGQYAGQVLSAISSYSPAKKQAHLKLDTKTSTSLRSLRDNSLQRTLTMAGAIAYVLGFSTIFCTAFRCWEYKFGVIAVLYALPLVPLCRFVVNGATFRDVMVMPLSKEERPESSLTLLLTLTGFSFAAFLLLLIESMKTDFANIDISRAAYYMFMSFIGFFLSFSVSFFNVKYWLDELRHSLEEVGRFSLLASSAEIIYRTRFPDELKTFMIAIAAFSWLWVFVFRVRMRISYFRSLRISKPKE